MYMQVTRDMTTGVVLIIAGVAMFIGARGFVLPVGMSYGAGFFPKIVSGGMAISGFLILLGDLRESKREAMRISWYGVRRITLLVMMIMLYAVALDPVGFHFSTFFLLFAVTLYFRAGFISASVLSVLATVILHFVFYSIMKVSLPWGILQPLA